VPKNYLPNFADLKASAFSILKLTISGGLTAAAPKTAFAFETKKLIA